jgi:hypothetical protein
MSLTADRQGNVFVWGRGDVEGRLENTGHERLRSLRFGTPSLGMLGRVRYRSWARHLGGGEVEAGEPVSGSRLGLLRLSVKTFSFFLGN